MMKHSLLLIALVSISLTSLSLAQSTGDFLLPRKTATGVKQQTITGDVRDFLLSADLAAMSALLGLDSITAAPAGSDMMVQFNDGGVLGGDSGLVFNKTTNGLVVDGSVNAASVVGQQSLYVPGKTGPNDYGETFILPGEIRLGWKDGDNVPFRVRLHAAAITEDVDLESPSQSGTLALLSDIPAGVTPAGSGSELQFRDGDAFGAVTRSSVSAGALSLGDAEAMGVTSGPLLTLRNTTAASSGAQQVSPSLVWEGRGWRTSNTTSQTVRYRANVLPVQGSANPSATWRLQSEIANSGTWVDRLLIPSEGPVYIGNGGVQIMNLNGGFGDINVSQVGDASLRVDNRSLILVYGGYLRFGFTGGSDVEFRHSEAGIMALRAGGDSSGAALELREQTAPASPALNLGRLYLEDNGAGKTRLMIKFATGAAQQIAIEP